MTAGAAQHFTLPNLSTLSEVQLLALSIALGDELRSRRAPVSPTTRRPCPTDLVTVGAVVLLHAEEPNADGTATRRYMVVAVDGRAITLRVELNLGARFVPLDGSCFTVDVDAIAAVQQEA